MEKDKCYYYRREYKMEKDVIREKHIETEVNVVCVDCFRTVDAIVKILEKCNNNKQVKEFSR